MIKMSVEELLETYNKSLERWKNHAFEPFVIVYVHVEHRTIKQDHDIIFDDKETTCFSDLGPYLNELTIFKYLTFFNPDTKFSYLQILRCLKIFKLVTRFASYFEFYDDDRLQFGWDPHFGRDRFDIHRTRMLKWLMTCQDPFIYCGDINDNDIPGFRLSELLVNDDAYLIFYSFWTKLPTDNLERNKLEQYTDIVNIEYDTRPFSKAMEESKKLTSDMLKFMGSMSDTYQNLLNSTNEMHKRERELWKKTVQGGNEMRKPADDSNSNEN